MDSRGQPRIAIIEDDPLARELISEICCEIGFHICNPAANGVQGLNVIEKEKPDIVIADLVMPEMDGLALVRTLRDPLKSPNPLIPIILTSANISRDMLFKARDVGVNAVLAKPLKATLVFDRLSEIIERPRSFVVAPAYLGPDRRRRDGGFDGPDRRASPT